MLASTLNTSLLPKHCSIDQNKEEFTMPLLRKSSDYIQTSFVVFVSKTVHLNFATTLNILISIYSYSDQWSLNLGTNRA